MPQIILHILIWHDRIFPHSISDSPQFISSLHRSVPDTWFMTRIILTIPLMKRYCISIAIWEREARQADRLSRMGREGIDMREGRSVRACCPGVSVRGCMLVCMSVYCRRSLDRAAHLAVVGLIYDTTCSTVATPRCVAANTFGKRGVTGAWRVRLSVLGVPIAVLLTHLHRVLEYYSYNDLSNHSLDVPLMRIYFKHSEYSIVQYR